MVILWQLILVYRINCGHHGVISSRTVLDLGSDEDPAGLGVGNSRKESVLARVDHAVVRVVSVHNAIAAPNIGEKVDFEQPREPAVDLSLTDRSLVTVRLPTVKAEKLGVVDLDCAVVVE